MRDRGKAVSWETNCLSESHHHFSSPSSKHMFCKSLHHCKSLHSYWCRLWIHCKD